MKISKVTDYAALTTIVISTLHCLYALEAYFANNTDPGQTATGL